MKSPRLVYRLSILGLFLSTFLLGLHAAPALELNSPDIHWKMMRLPHFDLIYDANHQELADTYASQLEEIVAILSQTFSAVPEKTLLVLNDRTDKTNGWANPIPQSTIMVYPVLPNPIESIYEHGDWPRELIMHEYTHILSFEPKRGVVKVLNSLFGSVITPTILLPRWWLEGIAVEMETHHSPYGRLRSTSQDGALRALVVDDKLSNLQLGDINESTTPSWPGGARPYLFGSLMWSEMRALRGEFSETTTGAKPNKSNSVDEIHQRYGGRIPFAINGPAVDAFELNYHGIFRQMIQDLDNRIQAQLTILKSLPTPTPDSFVSKKMELSHPTISPDGKYLAYLGRDETAKRSIQILKRHQDHARFSEQESLGLFNFDMDEEGKNLRPIPGKGEDGPPTGTISRIAWFPKSDKLLYDKVDDLNWYRDASDLWIFDIQDKKSTQLTEGLRAREATISPDESRIAFVHLGPGKTELVSLDLKTLTRDVLYAPPILSTVSFPVFLNDKELIFGERTRDGHEGLKKLNLATGEALPILADFKNAKMPQLSSQGLLFLSVQNGVSNLYLADQNLKSAKPLTHSLTEVGPGSLDPDLLDLYYTELTGQGQQIKIAKTSMWKQLQEEKLPKVKPLFADRYPPKDPASEKPPATPTYPIEDYYATSYLWPHYWIPGLLIGNDGFAISASTTHSDPVGIHSYALTAGYDGWTKRGTYDFVYNNAATSTLLSFWAYDYRSYLVMTDYQIRYQTEQIFGTWQLESFSKDLSGKLGWAWNEREISNQSLNETGPTWGFSYNNTNQTGEQISPETGNQSYFTHTALVRDSIHDGFNDLRAGVTKYFSRFLPKRHVLLVRLQGRWVEDNVNLVHYENTLAYPVFGGSNRPQYLMRGYATGTFLFKSLENTNLEYRFPLSYIYRGSDTTPLFIKRFHAALVADGIQQDGYAYNRDLAGTTTFPFSAVSKWKSYWDAGLELKADTTLGYHFPITFYLGAYWPFDAQVGGTQPLYAFGLMM